ncbi:XRE family transcriptional regulator [Sorangium sp. So ce1014]|uniref:ImmA/IrrE family metallo-endopeptidase n=1 Tax=Sorangium sp. So ce1014 TaxID=3133326 RepID=UPI003F62ED49
MGRLSTVLREARRAAKLSERILSGMVGLTEERLLSLEAGTAEATPEELDAYATVFGLNIADFAEGKARQARLTQMFFRSSADGGAAALDELILTGAQQGIGEFVRCTRDIAALEALLGHPMPKALPVPPTALIEGDSAPPHKADRLASWLRAELGLGSEPIPSMIELLKDVLGAHVVWVTPDQLHPTIEGAHASEPRAAVLVNLVEGPSCWWRTRMTLGHELCHLLCDQDQSLDRIALFSPHAERKELRRRWNLFDGFERIERRASAFAACLLAPEEAVKAAVGTRDVTSEEAITRVGQTFGLGRTTAINRLQHVFGLSQEVRRAMAARSASHWPFIDHPDCVRGGIGLRDGVLRDLAIDALAAGKIDRVRVRGYLRLPLTEPLAEDARLTPEQRAPVRRREDRIRAIAQQHVEANLEDGAAYVAAEVREESGAFRVGLKRRYPVEGEGSASCGYVILSYGLGVVDARLEGSRS